MKKLVALLALTVALSAPAWAATKTVTLSVPSMTCATCPITVKKALTKVEGVIEAKVTWEPKEAVVTYDDAKTTPAALTKATENAGYPSTVKKWAHAHDRGDHAAHRWHDLRVVRRARQADLGKGARRAFGLSVLPTAPGRD